MVWATQLESTIRKFRFCCSLIWPMPAKSKPVMVSCSNFLKNSKKCNITPYLIPNHSDKGSIPHSSHLTGKIYRKADGFPLNLSCLT